MIAAISQRNMKWEKGADRDLLENDYIEYFERHGIQALPVPNALENPEKYLRLFTEIDALILSGGNSLDARLYGSLNGKGSDFSEKRDLTEKALLKEANARGMPVLGICRGMQFINVFFGGRLEKVENHVRTEHEVKFSAETAKTLGSTKAAVNSFHNFGATKNSVSPKLKAFAESGDGVIEGLFHPGLPVAGIEWHPERMRETGLNKKIITAFRERKLFWKERK